MYLRGSFVSAASLDSGVWQGTFRLGVELTVIPNRGRAALPHLDVLDSKTSEMNAFCGPVARLRCAC
jgi:hypothetical protein